jgi:hypothetical protein
VRARREREDRRREREDGRRGARRREEGSAKMGGGITKRNTKGKAKTVRTRDEGE